MNRGLALTVATLWLLAVTPVGAQDPPPTDSVRLGERTKTTDCESRDGLPDAACTPGAIDQRVTQDTIGTTICVSGYTKTTRPSTAITDRVKRDQYAAYGLLGLSMAATELDHLVPLELGGAPADVANLWPEPYEQAWGARVKDRVENRLHELVCSGRLSLADAQQAMATDWKGAYQQYVGGAGSQIVEPAPSESDEQATDEPAPASPPPDAAPPQSQPAASANCSPSYPDFCIPPAPPDLNCTSPALAGRRNFTVLPPDPHRFDADHDGVGCESRR